MNKKHYCVGLSGNIASGKSTVAQLFKKQGIDIISADLISKTLTAQGTLLSKKIIQHFGAPAALGEALLNRRYLRQLISSDPQAKQWLEDLLHPIIRKEIQKQIDQSKSIYTIIEIPLLTNLQHYPFINSVIIVIARENTQIKRVMQRDQCTEAEAKAILNTQPSIEKRLQIANHIIENNGSKSALKKQVQQLHDVFINIIKNEITE